MEGTWSLSEPLTGAIPRDRDTPSLGSKRDEEIEVFPLFPFLLSLKITQNFVMLLPTASAQLPSLSMDRPAPIIRGCKLLANGGCLHLKMDFFSLKKHNLRPGRDLSFEGLVLCYTKGWCPF